jgi:hypothetical protein
MTDSVPEHVAESAEKAGPSRHYRRGRFIPVAKRHLVELLREHVAPAAAAAAQFDVIVELLDAKLQQEAYRRLARMKENYAVFDPDTDVIAWRNHGAAELHRRSEEIFSDVRQLLETANYRRMARDDVDAAVGALSPWGLDLQVELDIFDRLEVYSRGDKIDHRARRSWATFMRLKHYRIPLYQRLMVVFRPKGDALADVGYLRDRIYLKLFKNIPEGDVDMVLPGTRVRMTMLDQGKIWFPLFSGVAVTIWKVIKGALIVAAVGIYGLFAYLMLIIGTIGYGWRSFFGYQRTKEKYQLNLTQNLYYQKLDGNLGAMLRVADEAQDQEFRETLAAWFLLWRIAPLDGWLMEELDQSAEQWLQAELKRDVDFDVQDAVEKLIRLGLVDVGGDGRLTARSPERVIASLSAHA